MNKCGGVVRVLFGFLLVASAMVGLSGSTAGAWSTDDGAVAFFNDGPGECFEHISSSTVVDATGNMYMGGQFLGVCDFDPGPGIALLTSTLASDCLSTCVQGNYRRDGLMVKLDAAGSLVWAKQFGSNGTDEILDMALTPAGNIVVAGRYRYSIDFDVDGVMDLVGHYSPSAGGSFVAKFDSSGNNLWAHQTSSSTGYAKVAVDGTGNIFVSVDLAGSGFDFDPGPGVVNVSYNHPDAFARETTLTKFDSSGNFVWVKGVGGCDCSWRNADVAVDGAGNIYLAGSFRHEHDFDPGPGTAILTPSSPENYYSTDVSAFIVKLDSSGNYVWAKQHGGRPTESSTNSFLTVDNSGNVYTTGTYLSHEDNSVDFDPGPGTFNLPSTGWVWSDRSIYVLKLDTSGNFVWAKSVASGPIETTHGVEFASNFSGSIAFDGSGNVYTYAKCRGPVYFDTTSLLCNTNENFDPSAPYPASGRLGTNRYKTAPFLWKLDSAGNHVWTKTFFDTDDSVGNKFGSTHAVPNVVLDSSDNIYLSQYFKQLNNGNFAGVTWDFDPGPGTAIMSGDANMRTGFYVTKLDSSGNLAPGGMNLTTGSITVSPTSVTVAESGTTATFTVVLGALPASDVVLSLTASDTGEATIDKSTLTFTGGNWNTPQTVTVTGISDDAVDGDQNSTITISVVDASSPATYQAVADSQISVVTTDAASATPTLITEWAPIQCGAGLEPTPDGNFCVPIEIASPGQMVINLFASAAGSDGYVNWAPSTTNGLLEYVLAWRDPSGQPQTRTFNNTEIPEDVFYDLEDGTHIFEVLGSYVNGGFATSNEASITVPTPPPPPTENPEPIEVGPFDCDAFPSLIQVMGTPGLGHTVKQLDIQTGAYSDIFSISFNRNPRYTHLNGIGINPVDGALYGLMRVKGFGYLVRFDMAGNVGFVARVPAHSNAGDVDGLGRFIWPSGKKFYAISAIAGMDSFADPGDAVDMSRISPVHTRSGSGGHGIADAAALKVDLGQGERYYAMGVHTSDRKLRIYSYDNPTGFWTIDLKINGSPAQLSKGGFGAAWSHEDKIYFSSNSGDGVYEILIPSVNLNAGTANIRRVANSQASAINDGTTCIGIDFIPPDPTTTTTTPTTPDPAPDPTPDPAPDPTEPDPVDPTGPDPTEPDPTGPDPTPDPTGPDPTPDPTAPDPAPDPTEPDPVPDPTGSDPVPEPTGLLEEDETQTSTTTTLNIEEEVTSQALSKVETEDNEGLEEQSTKESLVRTSDSGSSTWKIILFFFSGIGIFLLLALLRRKRCLHCGRPLTLKDDILLDDDDNPECEENPEGEEHELRNDKRNEHENTVHSN